MKKMMKKLKSQAGASITFALLLFLVCAVISSIVIVAGSTAAGRMSQFAKNDQRYYAVTSAAELLKSIFDGKTATVEYVKDTDDASIVNAYVTMESLDASGQNKTIVKLPDDDAKIVLDASCNLVEELLKKDDSVPLPGDDPPKKQFTLDISSGVGAEGGASPDPATEGEATPQLACAITETINKNGLLVFSVSNSVPEDSKEGVYTLILTFSSDVREIATEAKNPNGKAKIKWKLSSMNIRKATGSGSQGG